MDREIINLFNTLFDRDNNKKSSNLTDKEAVYCFNQLVFYLTKGSG